MIQNYLIIDAHTHSYPTEDKALKIINAFTAFYEMEPEFVGKGTVDDILAGSGKYGIDYTVLANFSPLKILHENNLWTLSEGKKHKNLIPLISVHPDMTGDIAGLLKQYKESGAKGIKMHTGVQEFLPNNQNLSAVYAFCNDSGFPVFFHCGATSQVVINNYADLSVILPVIEAYPDMPVVLAHLAAGNPEDVLVLSQKYRNVFFDTSITLTGRHCIKRIHDDRWEDDGYAADMIRRVGYERIMFGSDYPFGSPADDIGRILRLNLSGEEKSGILGRNALRFYGIQQSGFPPVPADFR